MPPSSTACHPGAPGGRGRPLRKSRAERRRRKPPQRSRSEAAEAAEKPPRNTVPAGAVTALTRRWTGATYDRLMSRTTHLGACPLDCPDTCTWQLTVEDGRAVAIAGDRDHPFTRGALCGKINRYLDAVNGPDRLTHPMVRVGPKGAGPESFKTVSWDEAVGRVAAGLRATI